MLFAKLAKLFYVLATPQYRGAFLKYRVAASVESEAVLRNLHQGIQCVVDVGANRGQFSLAAHKNFPKAKVYCFEPLPEPFSVLSSVFQKEPLVNPYEMAIGESEAHTIMHVSKQDDSSSLLPITSLQSDIFPGTEEKETKIVPVKSLDSVLSEAEIEPPALLKIDVQGYEREVLKGCKMLLSKFAYICVECSFTPLYEGQALAHEIINDLQAKDFFLTGIYNLSFDQHGKSVQADFLFRSKAYHD